MKGIESQALGFFNEVLAAINREYSKGYADTGHASVAPELIEHLDSICSIDGRSTRG